MISQQERHKYTAEEVEFLKANVRGRSPKALQFMFNLRFNTKLSEQQVRAACHNRRLWNGIDKRFKPGRTPANKGMKGIRVSPATEFKKGHVPATIRPVGSEKLREDGYVWVKIAEPNLWRQKHVVLWEALHGSRPKKHAVLFADGDRTNFAPANLLLVSRSELAVMNHLRLYGGSRELTETGKLIADIKIRTADRLRQSKSGAKR